MIALADVYNNYKFSASLPLPIETFFTLQKNYVKTVEMLTSKGSHKLSQGISMHSVDT